jgi:hypothetical protein
MIYGHNKTIHRTGHLDVETDENGKVVSVWYRCMPLKFTQHTVDDIRAKEMLSLEELPNILAIEVEDKNGDKGSSN